MALCTIKLNAGHDRNGNPRRCFVVIRNCSGIVKVYDEGYRGINAITNHHHRQAFGGIEFNVSAGDYRNMLRMYRNA